MRGEDHLTARPGAGVLAETPAGSARHLQITAERRVQAEASVVVCCESWACSTCQAVARESRLQMATSLDSDVV
jgi:hypothetical protein